jgi:hypothetical protein
MHYLADFDTQTKLLHVGYSVLGMLVSMLVLVKFKPSIMPRMVTAVALGFILVFCLSTPLEGDQERLKNIYSIGWFSLGLLFGIGRGEFVIEYLNRKFFGAPDQLADQAARAVAEAALASGRAVQATSPAEIKGAAASDQVSKTIEVVDAKEMSGTLEVSDPKAEAKTGPDNP